MYKLFASIGIALLYSLSSGFFGVTMGADLLEKVILPAKEYEQIIDLGNNKQAVGNEVFRGGTELNTNVELACYQPFPVQVPVAPPGNKADCDAVGGKWHGINARCYSAAPIQVQGNGPFEKEKNCKEQGNEWVLFGGIEANKKEPIIVRITKWLLRITIALSITMVILIGIRFIWGGINGGSLSDGIKDVRNLIIGLLLALSSVIIIWLIQSITLSSLSGESANLDEVTSVQ